MDDEVVVVVVPLASVPLIIPGSELNELVSSKLEHIKGRLLVQVQNLHKIEGVSKCQAVKKLISALQTECRGSCNVKGQAHTLSWLGHWCVFGLVGWDDDDKADQFVYHHTHTHSREDERKRNDKQRIDYRSNVNSALFTCFERALGVTRLSKVFELLRCCRIVAIIFSSLTVVEVVVVVVSGS